MTPTLPCLPPSLLAYILEFALPSFTQSLAPQPRYLPLKQLKNVVLASKSMLASVRSLVADYRSATFCLNAADLELMEQFPTQEASIRDLRVQFKRKNYHFQARRKLETPTISWNIVLGNMTRLKKLDLGSMPPLCQCIPEILEAASTHCLFLEFLVMPEPSELDRNLINLTDESLDVEDFVPLVVQALGRWHSKGYCEGLKQLTVPIHPGEGLCRRSTELLEGIAKYCPRVVYLDSCDDTDYESNAQYVWPISLETWETFNASCTALRQFNFALAPFADPFFGVFGEYVKPKLKSLSLSANATWDCEDYLRDIGGLDQNSTRPGYGALATSPSFALKGCPALTTLFVQIDFHRNENPDFPGRYVNADVYGDTFWETVAEYCPRLESIEMNDTSTGRNFKVLSIETLTGRTLLALAGLKRLSAVELAPARLTGKDIFEYIRYVSKVEDIIGKQRVIHLKVGGHVRMEFSMPSFYSEILSLLILLSQESEESLGASLYRQKPIVHVWNPYRSKVNSFWCGGYLTEQLSGALEAVKAAHPSLGVAVHIQGRDGDEFSRIERVTLDWGHAHQREFFDMVEDEEDRGMYLEASIFEVNSGNESDESDDDD